MTLVDVHQIWYGMVPSLDIFGPWGSPRFNEQGVLLECSAGWNWLDCVGLYVTSYHFRSTQDTNDPKGYSKMVLRRSKGITGDLFQCHYQIIAGLRRLHKVPGCL